MKILKYKMMSSGAMIQNSLASTESTQVSRSNQKEVLEVKSSLQCSQQSEAQ